MALEIGALDITYGSDGIPATAAFQDIARSSPAGQDSGLRISDSPDLKQDGLGSFMQPSASAEPSVAGLRDRLLREARQERIRCLQVARASERWRTDEVGTSGVATNTSESSAQTDPVCISISGSSAPVDPSYADVWNQSDEEAQMDAIRTIQQLSQRKADTSASDRRIAELEELLNRERASRRELEAELSREKKTREAIQEQVLCLENEMDVKESALQAQQRMAERDTQFLDTTIGSRSVPPAPLRTQPVLGQANIGSAYRGASPLNLRSLNRSVSPSSVRIGASTFSHLPVGGEASFLGGSRGYPERDQKLQANDQQISQLLRELRQTSGDNAMLQQDPLRYQDLSPRSRLNLTSPTSSFGLHR